MVARRSIVLEGLDKDLVLGKVVEIKRCDGLQFIYLEEMKDGKWRLTYTTDTIPDITKLEALRIKRDDVSE